MRVSFGPFAFDPQSRLLWRDGIEIALPPRVLGVLEALIERPGEVVARQDLMDRVWKDSFVTDTSLAEAVSFLRSALGDDPQSPRYIQTVHRRGYRFLHPPTSSAVDPEPDRGQTGVRPGSDPFSAKLSAAAAEASAKTEHAEARVDWTLVPWSIAMLCAGLAAAAVWFAMRTPAPAEPPVARLEFLAAPGTAFNVRDPQPLAITADGRSMAWSACETATDRCAIYLRALDALEPRVLAGTDDGRSPVFSPDGRWVAFFADGALKKAAVAGGAPTLLANAPDPAGAAWGPDGRIAFAGSAAGGLSIVSGQGGAAQALTRPRSDRGELRHGQPAWLPDGALLFTIAGTPDADTPGELAALQPSSNAIRILRDGVFRAAPAGREYLLLASAADLQAATFDDRALVLTGPSDVVPAPPGAARFAAGASALAVVRTDGSPQRIWTDGADAAPLARLASIAISPDSRRAAGVIGADVWIADLATNALTRMTFGGTNVSPAWSADGRHIFFATRDGARAFRAVSLDVEDRTTRAADLPSAPPQAFPSSSAADGRVALTVYQDGRTAVAIVASGGAPRMLTDGPFDEAAAVFSPDGRWIALESTESGRPEVIVRAAAGGQRVAISTAGGRRPRWSDDGRSIYFEAGRRLLKAPFRPEDGAAPAKAAVVLDRAAERALAVTPSGRILVERQSPPDAAVFVLQWLRELRERLPLPVSPPR